MLYFLKSGGIAADLHVVKKIIIFSKLFHVLQDTLSKSSQHIPEWLLLEAGKAEKSRRHK